MKHHYRDIRDRAGDPVWHDEYGVPRYCDFTPREIADIYGDEVCLLLIRCQNCGREFRVALSWGVHDRVSGISPLAERVSEGTVHYGDPPNVECCPAGPTMNSIPVRVLEFWRRGDDFHYYRVPDLEGDLEERI